MAQSGQGAGEPSAALTARGSSRPATRTGAPGRSRNVAVALVALGMVRHALTSRRFYETAAVAVIALGSLRGISQDSRAGAMARLAAWNKREMERLEHKAERLEHKAEHQARAVKDAAERMAK
jgi:predicted alpha/beta hydrolase